MKVKWAKKGALLLFCQLLLMALIIIAPKELSVNKGFEIFGIFLIFCFLSIFIKAKFDLKEAFHPFPEPKERAPFISSGIYAKVRHPMYLSFILGGLGTSCIKQSVYVITLSIFLILILNIKYRYEDELLRNRWNEAATYQQLVPALFPKLGR